MLGGDPAALRDDDSGRVVWRGGGLVVADRRLGALFASEAWGEDWERWLPRFKYETSVARDLETGGAVYRVRASRSAAPRYWNAARTLAVAGDGSVYRLPLPVNWPLLALCQTILALPLVLLWAVLRWRRKRRQTILAAHAPAAATM